MIEFLGDRPDTIYLGEGLGKIRELKSALERAVLGPTVSPARAAVTSSDDSNFRSHPFLRTFDLRYNLPFRTLFKGIFKMRFWSRILLFSVVAAAISCGGAKQPATPLETFKTYTKAIKQKDTTTMKILLSDATIKMHEKEAKAQGVTVDDIVKQDAV